MKTNAATPKAVRIALRHVHSWHPTVTKVSFDKEGRWLYTDSKGNAPKFGPEIKVDILEDASNVVNFPSTYTI